MPFSCEFCSVFDMPHRPFKSRRSRPRNRQPSVPPAAFVTAYHAHDAAVLAELFTVGGELADLTTTRLVGGSELKGSYGMDDRGLLVLSSEDTQKVTAVEINAPSKMHFVLVGAPDRDPGLDFVKKLIRPP